MRTLAWRQGRLCMATKELAIEIWSSGVEVWIS